MDNFELNKLGWFTVQTFEENEFLNERLDNDQYGIYYNVKFEGDANTHLWQAKTAPVTGQRVYGHLELTKSGKTTKFRRAKKEDTPEEGHEPSPSKGLEKLSTELNKPSGEYWDDKNAQIRAQFAIKGAIELYKSQMTANNSPNFEELNDWAKELYAMVDRVKGSSDTRINLDDPNIPFNKLSGSSESTSNNAPVQSRSGYEKFAASRPTPKASEGDAEAESLYSMSEAGSWNAGYEENR